MAGVWGTLSLGFFTVPALAEKLATGTGGLFYGGGLHQLGTQALGLLAVGAFTFTASFGVLWLFKIDGRDPRPSEEVETAGLDVSEHGMWGYPEFYIPVPGGYGTESDGHWASRTRSAGAVGRGRRGDRARADGLGEQPKRGGAQARAPPRYTLARVTVTTAYPGRDGAHSAAACERLFPDAVPTPLPSFAAVAEAAASGAVTSASSRSRARSPGPVNETHDLLYGSPLSITGETVLPIHHCLVGIERRPASSRCARCARTGRARPVPPR